MEKMKVKEVLEGGCCSKEGARPEIADTPCGGVFVSEKAIQGGTEGRQVGRGGHPEGLRSGETIVHGSDEGVSCISEGGKTGKKLQLTVNS